MSTTHLTEEDEGKRIVASNGDELGMITRVREGIPYVTPDPNIFEKVKTKFDWGEPVEGAYPLKTVEIAEVTDDEVYLQQTSRDRTR